VLAIFRSTKLSEQGWPHPCQLSSPLFETADMSLRTSETRLSESDGESGDEVGALAAFPLPASPSLRASPTVPPSLERLAAALNESADVQREMAKPVGKTWRLRGLTMEGLGEHIVDYISLRDEKEAPVFAGTIPDLPNEVLEVLFLAVAGPPSRPNMRLWARACQLAATSRQLKAVALQLPHFRSLGDPLAAWPRPNGATHGWTAKRQIQDAGASNDFVVPTRWVACTLSASRPEGWLSPLWQCWVAFTREGQRGFVGPQMAYQFILENGSVAKHLAMPGGWQRAQSTHEYRKAHPDRAPVPEWSMMAPDSCSYSQPRCVKTTTVGSTICSRAADGSGLATRSFPDAENVRIMAEVAVEEVSAPHLGRPLCYYDPEGLCLEVNLEMMCPRAQSELFHAHAHGGGFRLNLEQQFDFGCAPRLAAGFDPDSKELLAEVAQKRSLYGRRACRLDGRRDEAKRLAKKQLLDKEVRQAQKRLAKEKIASSAQQLDKDSDDDTKGLVVLLPSHDELKASEERREAAAAASPLQPPQRPAQPARPARPARLSLPLFAPPSPPSSEAESDAESGDLQMRLRVLHAFQEAREKKTECRTQVGEYSVAFYPSADPQQRKKAGDVVAFYRGSRIAKNSARQLKQHLGLR
jgi:hypothetical protein